MYRTPKVAVVQDLSGLGRCSLSVILPVLSVMGAQCCPLPTAVLSAHTAFPIPEETAFQDLTDNMEQTLRHWTALRTSFDAIYSGFLGSLRQIDVLRHLIQQFRRRETLVLIDPVMGDHGRVYRTYTPEMCRAMAALAAEADVIVPNRTEASWLLDRDYDSLPDEAAGETVGALSMNGRRSVVLTGVSLKPGQTGAACFDRETGQVSLIQTDFAGRAFHGTGDLFASVLTGALVRGEPLFRAAERAAEFVRLCALHTAPQDLPPREGIDFEPLLGLLAPDRSWP